MVKILFIMFQGNATNLKYWNYHTESKFLDRLKKIGYVYTYQDKIHNIFHYEKNNPEHVDYDSDIDFNLSYVKPDTHITMIYNDICIKYKNINEYKFIPIGWSAGGGLALYFSQIYSSQCIHCILLDPLYITPSGMLSELNDYINILNEEGTDNETKFSLSRKPRFPRYITNSKLQKMLNNLKQNNNIKILEHVLVYSKHLNLELPNIYNPAIHKWQKDNNKNRLNEIKILKKLNPENYEAIIFENKSHMIYNKIQLN